MNKESPGNKNDRGKTRTSVIPPHGGYRDLKTFQIAEAIYDVTVRFCDRFIDRRSRTHDQMVQAARSGRQNIAEGSVDSAISKKMELKLTGVAKGSLEELRLDYEDFLRQRELPKWEPNHPALMRLKALRCATLPGFRAWVADEARRAGKRTDEQHGPARMKSGAAPRGDASQCRSVLTSILVANGALTLLNLCTYLLDQQLRQLEQAFLKEGGFTERLYKARQEARTLPTRPSFRRHRPNSTCPA